MTTSLIARPQLSPVAVPPAVLSGPAVAADVRATARAAAGAHCLDRARVAALLG